VSDASLQTSSAELEILPALPAAAAARARRRIPVSTVVSVLFLLVTALVIAVVPFLALYHPLTIDLSATVQKPFTTWKHPLGTDTLGRDELSRLALAGRQSIMIAVPALLLNMAVGVGLGLVAGYFGRIPNTVIMGLADLQISIPILLLLIMVVAVVGPGTNTLVLVLGLCYWVGYARIARVVALTVREREFVQAAKTFGASSAWIIRKHLLPQLGSQLAILASFDLGVIVILEASLSYLGLGIQPPTPSWGQMILEGQKFAERDVWLVLFPSIGIFLLIAGLQILSQRFTGERGSHVTIRTV